MCVGAGLRAGPAPPPGRGREPADVGQDERDGLMGGRDRGGRGGAPGRTGIARPDRHRPTDLRDGERPAQEQQAVMPVEGAVLDGRPIRVVVSLIWVGIGGVEEVRVLAVVALSAPASSSRSHHPDHLRSRPTRLSQSQALITSGAARRCLHRGCGPHPPRPCCPSGSPSGRRRRWPGCHVRSDLLPPLDGLLPQYAGHCVHPDFGRFQDVPTLPHVTSGHRVPSGVSRSVWGHAAPPSRSGRRAMAAGLVTPGPCPSDK